MSRRENRGRRGQPFYGLRGSPADYHWSSQQGRTQAHRGRGRGRGAFREEYQESSQGAYRPEYKPYNWRGSGRGRGAYRGNSREQSRDRLNVSRSSSPVEGSEEFTMRKIEQTSAIIMRHLLSSEEVGVRLPPTNKENPVNNKQEKEQKSKEEKEKVSNTSTPKKPKPVRKKRKSSTRSNEDSQSLGYDIKEIQNKIMNHITNMNDGKKRNLINAEVSGYDEAIRQIQGQKRLEISKALRNMCNAMDVGGVTTQESSNLINSIMPDVGIKIEDLPIEFIRSLRDVLGMDEKDNEFIVEVHEGPIPSPSNLGDHDAPQPAAVQLEPIIFGTINYDEPQPPAVQLEPTIFGTINYEDSSFQSQSTNVDQGSHNLVNPEYYNIANLEIKEETQDEHDMSRVTGGPEDEALLKSQSQKDNSDPGYSTQFSTQTHHNTPSQQPSVNLPPFNTNGNSSSQIRQESPPVRIKSENDLESCGFESLSYIKDEPQDDFENPNESLPENSNIINNKNIVQCENFSSNKGNDRENRLSEASVEERHHVDKHIAVHMIDPKFRVKESKQEKIKETKDISCRISAIHSDDLEKGIAPELKGSQDDTLFLLNYSFESDENLNPSGESPVPNIKMGDNTNVNTTSSYKNAACTANSLNDIVESFIADFKTKYGYCDTKNFTSVVGKMQFIDKCVEKLNQFRFSLFDYLTQQDIRNKEIENNLNDQDSKKRKNNSQEVDSDLDIHTNKKSRMQKADAKTATPECVTELNTSTYLRLKPASNLFEDTVEDQNAHKNKSTSKSTDNFSTPNKGSQPVIKDKINIINIVSANTNIDDHKSSVGPEAEIEKQSQNISSCVTDKIFNINFGFIDENEKNSQKITQLKIYGHHMFLASERGRIYVYDLNNNGVQAIENGYGVITSIAYLGNQERKTLYAGADAILRIHDLKSSPLQTKNVVIFPNDRIQCMELQPHWGFLFIGCASGTLVRYSISKEAIEHQDRVLSNIQVLKATHEGPRRVLIVGNRMAPMCIRDAMSGLILRELSAILPTTYSLVFHRNLVICGTSKQSILVYKYQEGTLLKRLPVASKGISCMEQYKNLLIAGCTDGSLYVYQFNQKMEDKNLELVYQKRFPGGSILCMAVLPRQIILKTMTKPICLFPMPKEILDRLTS